MAQIYTVAATSGLAMDFAAFVSRLAANITHYLDTRATRKALYALSDHDLNDIGLSRADIKNVSA